MNLLVDGVAQKAVAETGRKQKLLIDGHYEDFGIYRIRLDLLYFNDQNDRIATDISRYNASHPHNLISGVQHDAQYNALIHSFIVKSNEARLKTTQRNIQLYGQTNPGVVLADGRVIDGNRRFACLRNIQESTGAEQYFEASILEHTLGHNAKQIKQLELTIQLGQDRPVEYDPIDRLVGIYNDLICIQEDGKSLLTIQEYLHCLGTNSTEADIKADIERAKLMVEFLESINAPFQFYLAKQMNLNDPLKELHKIIKKCRNDEQKDDIKNVVFANLLMQPHGDMTRYIRKVGKVISNPKISSGFLDEQLELTEQVYDTLEGIPVVTEKVINEKIRTQDDLKEDFAHSTEKWVSKADGDATRNRPAQQAEKAYEMLDTIDTNIFKKLNDEQKDDIRNRLDQIQEVLNRIIGELDA